MTRAALLAALFGLSLVLSGCDKCGNFGPFFGLSDTKSCAGSSEK